MGKGCEEKVATFYPYQKTQNTKQNFENKQMFFHFRNAFNDGFKVRGTKEKCQWWQITQPPRPPRPPRPLPAKNPTKKPQRPLAVVVKTLQKPKMEVKMLQITTVNKVERMKVRVQPVVVFFDRWWFWLYPVSTFFEGSVNTRDYLKTLPKIGWKWN